MKTVDEELNDLNDSHNQIYNVYKELNSILPHNYLKIKFNKGIKYMILRKKKSSSLEENIFNRPKKKNHIPLQNINIYSFKENEKVINSNNSCNLEDSYKEENNYNNKKNLIRIIKLNDNQKFKQFGLGNCTKNSYCQRRLVSSTGNISNNYNDINNNNYYNYDLKLNSSPTSDNKNNSNRIRGIFNSSSINNFCLKSNMYLPKIIQRIKLQKPRYEREINGFKLIGTNGNINNNNQKKIYINHLINNNNSTNNNSRYSQEKNNISYFININSIYPSRSNRIIPDNYQTNNNNFYINDYDYSGKKSCRSLSLIVRNHGTNRNTNFGGDESENDKNEYLLSGKIPLHIVQAYKSLNKFKSLSRNSFNSTNSCLDLSNKYRFLNLKYSFLKRKSKDNFFNGIKIK